MLIRYGRLGQRGGAGAAQTCPLSGGVREDALIHLAWGYVQLIPEGIVVGTVRSRTLPWRGIAMIRTKPFWSDTVVEVRTADGRTRNLPAPAAVRAKDGPRFAQEAALIQQWWAYCRGW